MNYREYMILLAEGRTKPLPVSRYDAWTERIARHYGYDSQSHVLLEEMAELQKEILKNRRGADNRSSIIAEMADVYIMLNQMIELLDISYVELNLHVRNKLSRQLKRIRKENREKRK